MVKDPGQGAGGELGASEAVLYRQEATPPQSPECSPLCGAFVGQELETHYWDGFTASGAPGQVVGDGEGM